MDGYFFRLKLTFTINRRKKMKKTPVLISTAEEEKKPCLFLGNCFVGKPTACTMEEMEKCGEAQERQNRAKKPCPIMKKSREKNQKCNVPQLLPFLPLGFACYDGDDCVLCKIVPKIVERVAKNNYVDGPPKMSAEDMEEAGAAVIKAIKTR